MYQAREAVQRGAARRLRWSHTLLRELDER
jgi:hypothetical protein